MKNYFENADVNWKNWQPRDVIFKSGIISKKYMPEENLLSYKSKGDRNTKMGELQGRGNHKAVHVVLKDTKGQYPTADIDFLDWNTGKFSNGMPKCSLDVLVYLVSRHQPWEWQRDANGNWKQVSTKKPAPISEGYQICYGGQGDNNPMDYETFSELLQISEAVRSFLIEVVHGQTDSVVDATTDMYAFA